MEAKVVAQIFEKELFPKNFGKFPVKHPWQRSHSNVTDTHAAIPL